MSSDKLGEEFANFMRKVNDVGGIISKLSSKNKEMQEIGTLEADKYLNNTKANLIDTMDEENIFMRETSNRTVINKRVFQDGDGNQANMSQNAFMAYVSEDADRRYKERLVREERMETFLKRANNAYRAGEYEKALCFYNKAIEQIKSKCTLYINRALTYIHLQMYDKAIDDITNWALKINESSLKAWLVLAKAHFLNEDDDGYGYAITQATIIHPRKAQYIEEFCTGLLEKKTKAPSVEK